MSATRLPPGTRSKIFSARPALYDELVRSTLSDVEWEPSGVLFVFRSDAAFDHYAQTDALLRREFSLAATPYDGDDLPEFDPSLKPGSAGLVLSVGWLAASRQVDGRLEARARTVGRRDPRTLRNARPDGRRTRRPPRDHRRRPGRRRPGADRHRGLDAQLSRVLRCPVPIQPGKGYSITMSPALCPRRPMIFEEHRVAISPMQSGYRIGSTMEFAGYDAGLNPARLTLLRKVPPYLERAARGADARGMVGLATDDARRAAVHRPSARIRQRLPGGRDCCWRPMAPATGKLVAELMTGQRPSIDPIPYAVTHVGRDNVPLFSSSSSIPMGEGGGRGQSNWQLL